MNTRKNIFFLHVQQQTTTTERQAPGMGNALRENGGVYPVFSNQTLLISNQWCFSKAYKTNFKNTRKGLNAFNQIKTK